MSLNLLSLAAFFTILLSSMVSGFPQETGAIAQIRSSIQSTKINLDSSQLNQPLWLKIQALDGGNLQGEVKLNGQVIKKLKGSAIIVDLSNYLSQGNHEISITGSYYPTDSLVVIELTNNTTQINQQTSGTGTLNQQVSIGVK